MTRLPGYYSPDENYFTDNEVDSICEDCEQFMSDWRKQVIADAIAEFKAGDAIEDVIDAANDQLNSWPSPMPDNFDWWREYHGTGVGVLALITAKEIQGE